jgi:hypothetical protein
MKIITKDEFNSLAKSISIAYFQDTNGMAEDILTAWFKAEGIPIINEGEKPFEVYYCFGGPYKGSNKRRVTVCAKDEEGALIAFKDNWPYEGRRHFT